RMNGWWRTAAEELARNAGPRGFAGWLGVCLLQARTATDVPRLAIAELLVACARDERLRKIAAALREDYESFWTTIAERATLPPAAAVVLGDFTMSCLLSPNWSVVPSVNTPWVSDACARLVARLCGERKDLVGWDGWSALSARSPYTDEIFQE